MFSKLHITEDLLRIFKQDLWKDLRRLEVLKRDERSIIRRFADGSTTIPEECDFINRLKKKVDFCIPEIWQCADEYIAFGYIEGTRAFNLLIDLKTLYARNQSSCYKDLGLQLLDLLQSDLKEFQRVMMEDAAFTEDHPLYPAKAKMRSLYRMLTEILPETCGFSEIVDDLERITSVYTGLAVMPFRDATPKNCVLEMPSLFQQKFRSYKERLRTVNEMCLSGELHRILDKNKLYQIDFSGCKFLCPVSDDWVALQEHESTNWLTEANRPQPFENGLSDLCTRFVRFTRFGGRKLAYRLMNYEGYKIRFVHDNESYYFSRLADICRHLRNYQIVRSHHLENLMSDLLKWSRFKPEHDYLQDMPYHKNQNPYYSDIFPN